MPKTGPRPRLKPIPGRIMAELRKLATSSEAGGKAWTQERTARALGIPRRSFQLLEEKGGRFAEGYAYVGLAFRLGGPEHGRDRALRVLEELAQPELGLEGIAVDLFSFQQAS